MQKEIMYGIGGLSAGLLLATFVLSNPIGRSPGFGMMSGRYSSSLDRQNSTIDKHFIEQMIPHHEDAITMADIALARQTRPEIQELSNNIKTSQSAEIQKMQEWYKQWYGSDVPQDVLTMQGHGMRGNGGGMHMGMMGDETDIDSLTNADDFDKEFISQMIPHHQMAVMMAQMLLNSTDRPEMKQLAEDIIEAQTAEINQMREWLATWE